MQARAQWVEGLRQSGRFPAFLVHLGISAALVALLGAAAYFVWYPPPYFEFDGGWRVMKLVILVDVVLGPLLTLIVFRRGKKTLKLDLGVIAALQLAAFVYGTAILVQYRPAYLVYAQKAFFSVNRPDMEKHTKDLARTEAMRPWRGPVVVVLELPPDPAEHRRIQEAAQKGGPRIILLGDYYQPMTPGRWSAVLREGIDIETQLRAQPDLKEDVERFRSEFLDGSGMTLDKLAFYPAVVRYGYLMLALRRDSGALFGWLHE